MISLFLLAAAAAAPPDFELIAREAQGHVGAMAMVVGEPARAVGIRQTEHFPMQSVYKFPIAMAVLHAVDQGKRKQEEPVRVRKGELVPVSLHSPIRDEHPGGDFDLTLGELLRYAVSESDGTASDVLMRVVGGPGAVQAYLHTLGVDEVRIVTPEMEMARDNKAQYRNWATPRGAVALLQALQEGRGLSPASRQRLLDLMTRTASGPNRIKGLLPAGTTVAHKTGFSGTVNGFTAAANDVGLISMPGGRTLAVAVFVSDSTADERTRDGVMAKIARAAWDFFF